MLEKRIAYFGTGQSNTYQALCRYLLSHFPLHKSDPFTFTGDGLLFQVIPGGSIPELTRRLSLGDVDEIFLPFVNSDAGLVSETRQAMFDHVFYLLDSYDDTIVLYAYVHPQNKGVDPHEIESIYSNVPCLNECSDFVNRHVPFATYRSVLSTTQGIEEIVAHPEKKAIAFANDSFFDDPRVALFSEDPASNNGSSKTKFLLLSRRLIQKREIPLDTLLGVKQALAGYYIYHSYAAESADKSVKAASWMVVKMALDGNNEVYLKGYTVGFVTENLFDSLSTSVDIKGEEVYFYYQYRQDLSIEKKVNGICLLRFPLESLLNGNKLEGTYFGYNNNKSGHVSYRRISKEEFDVYTH